MAESRHPLGGADIRAAGAGAVPGHAAQGSAEMGLEESSTQHQTGCGPVRMLAESSKCIKECCEKTDAFNGMYNEIGLGKCPWVEAYQGMRGKKSHFSCCVRIARQDLK